MLGAVFVQLSGLCPHWSEQPALVPSLYPHDRGRPAGDTHPSGKSTESATQFSFPPGPWLTLHPRNSLLPLLHIAVEACSRVLFVLYNSLSSTTTTVVSAVAIHHPRVRQTPNARRQVNLHGPPAPRYGNPGVSQLGTQHCDFAHGHGHIRLPLRSTEHSQCFLCERCHRRTPGGLQPLSVRPRASLRLADAASLLLALDTRFLDW